ncbi:hypothetical protein CR513_28157, partial [Mucuna pruriens]
MDMTLDHTQLQNMEKKENETFKGVIGNLSLNFSNLVIIGERVEMRVRSGRIAQGTITTNANNPPQQQTKERKEKQIPTRAFAPIPMTYTKLLTHLIQNIFSLQLTYPKHYDPNAKCDYHAGSIGHTIKKHWGLKHKVQDLMDAIENNMLEEKLSLDNHASHEKLSQLRDHYFA